MSSREVSLGVLEAMVVVVRNRDVDCVGLTQPGLYNARPRKLEVDSVSKSRRRRW